MCIIYVKPPEMAVSFMVGTHEWVFTGRRIAKLEVIRHKSDYDDFYIASREEALVQIETAEEIMLGIAVYVNNKHESGK